jgi:hypothetical protein
MAFMRLHQEKFMIDVLVGAEETYTPPKGIKTINNKLKKLKKDTADFVNKQFNTTDKAEIDKILKEDEEKQELWNEFVANKYVPAYEDIIKRVEKINKKICPNYSALRQSKK